MTTSKYHEVLKLLEAEGLISDAPRPLMQVAKVLSSRGHYNTPRSAANALERNPHLLIDYDNEGRRSISRRNKKNDPLDVLDFDGNFHVHYVAPTDEAARITFESFAKNGSKVKELSDDKMIAVGKFLICYALKQRFNTDD